MTKIQRVMGFDGVDLTIRPGGHVEPDQVEEKLNWQVKYFLADDLSEFNLQNSRAADDRSYCDDQNIPWKEEKCSVENYKPINFYDKCCENISFDKEPFIPVSQSGEIMRIVEKCRQGFDDVK